MNRVLDAIRKVRVRRSTIYLCVAWVALFVLYLGVRPEPVPQADTTTPVVAPTTTRAPVPTRTVAPTTESTTTEEVTPTETTSVSPTEGETGRAPATTTRAPLIPPELVPPGLQPTTQSPQTTGQLPR